MEYYRIDGVRMDSVNNIQNYDFVGEFKDWARSLWQKRGGTDERFLVVGEELAIPLALLTQNRLDGLWNENFKRIVRRVILGENAYTIGEPSFEWSVRKLIDCRNLGFTDGSQAVFSDYGSPGGIDGEYIVPNWPLRDKVWREITQERVVTPEKVGREPIFPWEAKVYAPM